MSLANRVWSSNVPAAMSTLFSLIEAKVDSAGADVLVKDGQWISAESAEQVLVVGWSGFTPDYQLPRLSFSEELGSPAVTVTTTQSGLEPAFLEAFEIQCASICRTGDKDITTARNTAYANMGLVGQIIDDFIQTPPVAKATMAATSALHQVNNGRGIDVIITFSIECQAWAQ